jgi:hypothetical protein
MAGFESPLGNKKISKHQYAPRNYEVPDGDFDVEEFQMEPEMEEQIVAETRAKEIRQKRKQLTESGKSRLETLLGIKRQSKDIKIGSLTLNIKIISSAEDENATFLAHSLITSMIKQEMKINGDDDGTVQRWYDNSELINIRLGGLRVLIMMAYAINSINGQSFRELVGSDDINEKIKTLKELDELMSDIFLATLIEKYNEYAEELRQELNPPHPTKTVSQQVEDDLKKA